MLAYDTIYALVDLPDDLKIGIKTSAITFGKSVIAVIMLCYNMFLFIMCMVGVEQNLGLLILLRYCVSYIWFTMFINKLKAESPAMFQKLLFNNQIGILLTTGVIVDFWFK